MGWQIALTLAAHGRTVRLHDASADALDRARARIAVEGPTLASSGALPEGGQNAGERVSAHDDLDAALDSAWLVIEAVPERLDVKRTLFRRLSERVSPDVILATNSSSFKSRLLVEAVSHPARLMNAHFNNVPWQRPAVELMTCGVTDPENIRHVADFMRGSGLIPVVARVESTGFIYNRVWHAIKKECLKVVAEGVADPEEIDRLWCLSLGTPMGPFGMMDRVGLDVVLDIERHYAGESGDTRDDPPAFLAEMVARGLLGRKTGEGFYRYPGPPWERAGWPRSAE
jgi:3-hydroxybutyryl-CoA dehydrogenase